MEETTDVDIIPQERVQNRTAEETDVMKLVSQNDNDNDNDTFGEGRHTKLNLALRTRMGRS